MRRPIHLSSFCLLCIFILFGTINRAQEAGYPLIAAYNPDGELWLYEDGKPSRQIENAALGNHRFPSDFTWSSDGKLLAYRSTDGLAILNVEDNSITTMMNYPFDDLPFAFTRDNSAVLFGVDGGADGSNGTAYLNIAQHDIKTGLPLDGGLSSIERATGYGADFSFIPPPTPILIAERGLYIGGWRFLADTSVGILHASLIGLQLNHETLWPIAYGVLSPDGTQVATFNVETSDNSLRLTNGIAIIHLPDKQQTIIETSAKPSLIAWGGNNKLFYTSEESLGDFYDGLNDQEKAALQEQFSNITDGSQPYLSHNQVQIHQINLTDFSEEIIYQSEAFAIGRLMASPDGNELFFSTIPNMDTWLEHAFIPENLCLDLDCAAAFFQPSLYRLTISSGKIELIGTGLYGAAINFGLFR